MKYTNLFGNSKPCINQDVFVKHCISITDNVEQ